MFDEILKILRPLLSGLPTGENVRRDFEALINGVERLNSRFTQSRQRVTEFSAAIADSTPMVNRLGGSATDVADTIDKVSQATKRNVVASAEEVTKLYAAQKLTGTDAKDLVDKFQNVGVAFSQVGSQMESSIKYIQSIGGNARDIMREVNKNVEKINSYNFRDGVLGLTRMATQAQLLKFDMNKTLDMAEKALTPESAIEMASAFQRLGVAAGDLTDPFQLMYKSLNDPEGLQNSLISMTKQFTYFDEKTKQFKIEPQGMLMLREIGKEANISAAELSKLALNSADLDAKLSQISPSFEFENEDDKQYIANIAKMGQGGEYEVTVKRDGKDQTVLLQEATNDELRELVERQKRGQEDKSLIEIQKDQLSIIRAIQAEMISLRTSFSMGAASSSKLTEAISGLGMRNEAMTLLKNFVDKQGISTTPEFIRGKVDEKLPEIIQSVEQILKVTGPKLLESTKGLMEDIKKTFESTTLTKTISDGIQEAMKKMRTLGEKGWEFLKNAATPTKDLIVTNEGAFEPAKEDVVAAFQKGGIITETMKDITTSNPGQPIDLKPLTEVISKTETITKKFEFGDIPPIKIIFEKSPDFTDSDMAILEYNLQKDNISEKLAVILQNKLKTLQEKST